MTQVTVELCSICEKVLEDKQGLAINVCYSDGGWGQSKDFMDFSGEVCNPCFDALMSHLNLIKIAYLSRKGVNRPTEIKI